MIKLTLAVMKLSKNYREFKNGGELAEKTPITMEEALKKVGGKAKGLLKNAKHHDAPQTLQKLFDALEYDNHAVTHPCAEQACPPARPWHGRPLPRLQCAVGL